MEFYDLLQDENAPALKRSKTTDSSGTPPSGKIQILDPCLIRF